MKKSNFEQQYEKLIIQHISNLNVCPEHRAMLYYDFFQNSSTYYDELCDLLYYASAGNVLASLWMSQSGEIYSSAMPKSPYHAFLLDSHELPSFQGDLMEHLDYVFSRIYSLSAKGKITHLCMFS